jgi:tRNA threonylcarbamoyladenosine biosynthesis protein TsaB
MTPLLAFDTATDQMSIALQAHGQVWTHEGAGGAQASSTLIPAILALLEQASLRLQDLAAIAFGRGPGAFTGLRTACSVAQGLAFGAGLPVLPIDSLCAVAEDARGHSKRSSAPQEIWVAMDARMGEIYAACYAFDGSAWRALTAPLLMTPAALNAVWRASPPGVVAGSALTVFADALNCADATLFPAAMPRARAMLSLAQPLWLAGGAVDAAMALPLYVRDKVAQTTLERDEVRRARELASVLPMAAT